MPPVCMVWVHAVKLCGVVCVSTFVFDHLVWNPPPLFLSLPRCPTVSLFPLPFLPYSLSLPLFPLISSPQQEEVRALWTREYLSAQMGDKQQRAESNNNNHFMYYRGGGVRAR